MVKGSAQRKISSAKRRLAVVKRPSVTVKRPAVAKPVLSEVGQQLRSALTFAFGVIAVALLLFFAVRQMPEDRQLAEVPPVPTDALLVSLKSAPDFRSWLTRWQAVDPYVGDAEFVRGPDAVIPATDASSPQAMTLQPPLADRYVWSPNKIRFIDYLASYGEPDSKVVVYNRNGDNQTETLGFCGTPCGFDAAFWLDDARAVVLGHSEGSKADGSPLCVAATATAPGKCYSHLTVSVYDFDKNLKQDYVSDNHLFAKNPLAQAMHDRWVAGLSPQERTALGEAPNGQSIVIHGTVIDVAADSRIVSIAVDGGGQRFVTLVPSAVLHGVDGMLGTIDVLRKGATVEVTAVRAADGTVMALSARVLAEPVSEKVPTSSASPKKKSAR